MKRLVRKTARGCLRLVRPLVPSRVRGGLRRLFPALEHDSLASVADLERATERLHRELDAVLRELRRLHRRIDDLEDVASGGAADPAFRRAA